MRRGLLGVKQVPGKGPSGPRSTARPHPRGVLRRRSVCEHAPFAAVLISAFVRISPPGAARPSRLVRLPGNHELVTPVTSTNKSMLLSVVSSPRAAEPNSRIFPAPWRAAARTISSLRSQIIRGKANFFQCIERGPELATRPTHECSGGPGPVSRLRDPDPPLGRITPVADI